MRRRALSVLSLCLALALSSACGRSIDLTKLKLTNVITGYYDDGIQGGLNKLVPSVSFSLENTDTIGATEVQLVVSFWHEGDDGELSSKEVAGIGSKAIAPNATGDPILVRSDNGYTIETARDTLFTHSMFKDFKAIVLAKRDGKIVRLGELKIDRRILPRLYAGNLNNEHQ